MTNHAQTRMRRLAVWLTTVAGRCLPPAQRAWADAMLGELHHVDNDWEALRWSVGCVIASQIQRARTDALLEKLPVRLIVFLIFMQEVFNDLFMTTLKLAYSAHLTWLTERLGRMTPLGDYRPYVGVMNSIPAWLYAMWTIGAALFATSAVRYARRWPSAFPPFLAAFMINIVGLTAVMPLAHAAGLVADAAATTTKGVILECAIAVLMWTVLLRRDSRTAEDGAH